MKNITDRFYDAMERQLNAAVQSDPAPINQCTACIKIAKKAMSKLKRYMASYDFKTTEDEIHFFKVVKPRFYSRYIYFVNMYNYWIKQPPGDEGIQKEYIKWHLGELKRFFDRNHAFYQYYRSGSTQMDPVYFTRSGFDVHIELDDFEEDEQYSTSHDYKLAKLVANERFQDFLKVELAKIGNEDLLSLTGQKPFPFRHPQWTASQTDAVELLYALKTGQAVNNGNIDIAELVAIWEFIFQMEIHESYHKLLDITRRKKEMFVFLNRIMDSFWNFIRDKFS